VKIMNLIRRYILGHGPKPPSVPVEIERAEQVLRRERKRLHFTVVRAAGGRDNFERLVDWMQEEVKPNDRHQQRHQNVARN